MFCDFILVTLPEEIMGLVSCHLIGRNNFLFRQKMRDAMLRARVVVRSSNLKIPCRCLADYVKKIALKSMSHVQHDYFFLVQPIGSLICGVVVDADVVVVT